MSTINDCSITIYEAMTQIRAGRYAMPAFQRQFVWNMEQIEKLWDSILLDYPIATFLFWHVDNNNITSDTYFCNFLSSVTFNSGKHADSTNYELSALNLDVTHTAVLDGQQRLTSLYLSLFGDMYIRQRYARKNNNNNIVTKLLIELNNHNLEIADGEYNSEKFGIRFNENLVRISPTQFELRTILEDRFRNDATREKAIEDAIIHVPADSKDYARNLLNKLYRKIFVEKLIRYTNICDMNQEDALEMFVRFNSGGKVLSKSEITMSILEVYWPSARSEIGRVLVGSYCDFSTDFIIRATLMLYGDVTKTNINQRIAATLRDNWVNFRNALNNLETVLNSLNTEAAHFTNRWNVLLPIFYYIYNNPNFAENLATIKVYLVRAILFKYFQSSTTTKLQQMKSYINDFNYDITMDMLNQINELRVTDGKIEDILNAEKDSPVAAEALYFLCLDWTNKETNYELDHLHPNDRFDNSKPFSVSANDWLRWRNNRNKLPNLELLDEQSNRQKTAKPLNEYYNDMNTDQQNTFRQQAMIPEDLPLDIDHFEDFYNRRKAILSERIRLLLG